MNTSATSKLGWVLYDFANSSYHLLIPTVLMPLYFRQYLAEGQAGGDARWAIVVAVPVLIAGLLGPLLGGIADVTRKRLTILACTAFAAIAFCAVIPLTEQGDVVQGSLWFVLSYTCFTLSLGLYDSFLPLLTEPEKRGRLSGSAWGIGYLGGIAALIVTFPLLKDAQLPTDVGQYRRGFWLASGFYALFALVAFYFLRAQTQEEHARDSTWPPPIRAAGARVWKTVRNWRENRPFWRVLLSYYLCNDGLATLTYFTAIYAATTLGFNGTQILTMFLLVQVIGVPATAASGILADRYGHVRVLRILVAIWILLTVGFALGEGVSVFYALSLGTGLVIGSTPALFRSLLAQYVDKERTAEMFGFSSFTSRVSAVAGPLLFGAISSMFGSQRVAMASLALFFTAGVFLLGAGRGDQQLQWVSPDQ